MAQVERRESGRWRARYRAPDGRERSKTFDRKVDAQRFLAGVETEKARREWIDPRLGRTRFGDFAGRWMDAVAPTLKPTTVASYASLLRSRVRPAFGDWATASVRPSDVQAWVGEMIDEGLSPSRIRQAHVVLSLRRRLRIAESGTEVGGRLEYGQTKSYAVRQLPLTPALLAQLETHLTGVGAEPEAPLFVSPDGGPLRHSNFYHRLWRPALRNLGLPEVGLHVLRHSAAARMIGAGASPKAVQVVLGHRSAAFTLTVYGHLFDADLDDLALRLDGEPGSGPEISAAWPRPGATSA